MLIPALYQAVETLHIFIPVLAILACVIIFACGMRSSKSAQPPEEYLSEIKAKTKQKTKNLKLSTNPSKSAEKHSQSGGGASEKQSNNQSQKSTSAKTEEKKVEANESPKKAPAKSPKHGPTKPAAFAEKLPKTGSESPQNSAWVTVSSKRGRKEMKEAQAVKNGTVVQPLVSSPVSAPQNTRKISEGTSSEQRASPVVEDFSVRNDVAAVDPEDAEEAWMMGKDSRYRKSKRGKGQEKEAAPESPGPASEKLNAGNGNIDDFIPAETRKRRNVRRDN